MDSNKLLTQVSEIQNKICEYITEYNIKALIIGVSGGFDSGFNSVILKPVCDKLDIPLIGAYIHIETNKKEESERAKMIGKHFCNKFFDVDLTKEYHLFNEKMNHQDCFNGINTLSYAQKVKHGNIKARLRMIYLYNLAASYGGIVIDNDNKSEHMLGFWTINGDVGDITPLASFFKTELYELAKEYLNSGILKTDEEKLALQMVIDAVPTDGLGISSSDVEQFGVSSYDEVDNILRWIEKHPDEPCPYEENSGEAKVWHRWKNSFFKRHHPYRIKIEKTPY